MKLRRSYAVAAALLATVMPASFARADATADAKKAIQANYDRGNNGLAHKDTKAIIDLHSSDYQAISKKGKKTTLANLKQSAAQIVAIAKTIKVTTTVQKIVLKGQEALVTAKQLSNIVLVNPQKRSEEANIIADETLEHTWVKGSKGWLIKKSRVIASKATVNGQPMPDSP